MRDAGIDVPVRNMGIPERFLDQGKRAEVLVDCGLTAQEVSRQVVEAVARLQSAADPGEARQAEPTGSDLQI